MWKTILSKVLMACSSVVVVLIAWQAIIWIFEPPIWLFPDPQTVWERFLELWRVNAIQPHIKTTGLEVVIGYCAGISFGMISGYAISQIRILEKLLTPYLVAANSVPLVAFAPLLILWFGSGIETKIIVTALIVYFPMTVSTITGFHQQSPWHKRLLNSLHANKWQRFRLIELPSAIPGLLAGMKIGAPLAVVGAVVGEFLGTGEGLGHVILEANGLLDTPQLFVAMIILGWMGIFFYLFTLGLEKLLIGPWHSRRRNMQ